MKRAPCAVSALVTWKLPLPTTPKTVRTPASASALPTASATVTRAAMSASHECQHAGGRARTGDDRQWGRDHHRAGCRETVEVAQLGQAILVRPEDHGVAGVRRVEATRLAGVRADGLHPDAQQVRAREVLRGGRGDARGMR